MLLLTHAIFSQEPAERRPKEKNTDLRIQVVAGEANEPVKRAEVFVKVEDKNFEQTVRTNGRGVVNISGVPRGRVFIQVTATNCITSSTQYELSQDSQTIQIKLQKVSE